MMVDTEIPTYLEVFYIQSMLFNSQSAIDSINNIKKIIDSIEEDNTININNINSIIDIDYFLNNTQNIILQGGGLSRYFFPSKGERAKIIHKNRSIYLRDKFNVSEGNPLENRQLRNAIEHFDEKLDSYLKNGLIGHVIPQIIGDSPRDENISTHIFRAYYLNTYQFEILGNRFDMIPIINEIIRIHNLLIAFDKNSGNMRLPSK